jgi:hypothetical protein
MLFLLRRLRPGTEVALVLLVLVATLPLLGALLGAAVETRREREADLALAVAALLDGVAHDIERQVREAGERLAELDLTGPAESADATACARRLARLGLPPPSLVGVLVLDPAGRALCASGTPEVAPVHGSSEPVLPVALPLHDAQGTMRATAIAVVDLESILRTAAQRHALEGTRLTLGRAEGHPAFMGAAPAAATPALLPVADRGVTISGQRYRLQADVGPSRPMRRIEALYLRSLLAAAVVTGLALALALVIGRAVLARVEPPRSDAGGPGGARLQPGA